MSKIASEIKELGRQLEIEKSRHYIMTEEQVVANLTALADGVIRNSHYRKTLIKLFVNRIDLYDDRYTIIFNTGDDEVTITDRTLEKIERSSNGEKSFCLSNVVGHHTRLIRTPYARIYAVRNVFVFVFPFERQ